MGRRGGAAILALISAALALPGAGAVAVEGELVVESGAAFPPSTRATLVTLGALLGHAGPGTSLHLEAPVLTVHLYEKRFAEPGGLVRAETGFSERAWRLTGVRVDAVPGAGAGGHVALEPGPGTRLDLVASTPVRVEHRAATTLSSDGREATVGPQDARASQYWREVRGDHLYLSAPGTLAGEARGALRVQGLDLVLRASQNTTTLWTGERAGGPGESVVRWAYLTFDAGALRLASQAAPLQVVAAEAERVAWTGAARLVAVEGSVHGEDVEYVPAGPARVEGDLSAALEPVPGDLRLLRLVGIRGDLASTSLAAHPRAPAAALGAPVAPFAAFALGAVASAGAVLGFQALRRRAPRRGPPTREDLHEECLAWAAFFEEQEDAAAALECLQAARRHAEDDEYDLVLWEASCLDRLGRLEDALERYEAAVAVAPKGDCEAAFAAAIVAAQLNRADAALMHLRLSLMADPFLLEVVDALASSDEDPFLALRRRLPFRQLLRDARTWVRAAGELRE